MRRQGSQRGDGKLGCVLWLALLIVVVLVAWKAIPVKLKSTEFHAYLDELAKFNAARTQPEDIKKMIINKAGEMEIPIDPTQVAVIRRGDFITIQADYTIPVELLGFTYQWHFHEKLDRQIFIV
jgi:hypothetical protein